MYVDTVGTYAILTLEEAEWGASGYQGFSGGLEPCVMETVQEVGTSLVGAHTQRSLAVLPTHYRCACTTALRHNTPLVRTTYYKRLATCWHTPWHNRCTHYVKKRSHKGKVDISRGKDEAKKYHNRILRGYYCHFKHTAYLKIAPFKCIFCNYWKRILHPIIQYIHYHIHTYIHIPSLHTCK